MRAACRAFHAGNRDEAIRITAELVDHLKLEAAALNDDALRNEVALVQKLLENVSK